MDIKTTLETIAHYYGSTRQVGHTTLVKKGLENTETPSIVCLHSNDYKQHFADNSVKHHKYIALSSVHPKLLGANMPLVFDHEAIRHLCVESLRRISYLEGQVEQSNKMINDFRDVFAKYNMLD